MARPLQESDLIFPTAASALNTVLGDLKRSNLTIKNRLHSIQQDSIFVENVANAYQLPLIANERCGSWYISPDCKAGSAYFKSTDGHFNQWMFSLRRLNVQVLDVVGRYGGCVLVDSTRRGKSMPDALSKTVPIWAAVLNRLLFPQHLDHHCLKTPTDVVSASEHAQIEARLGTCLLEAQALNLDLDELRAKLGCKPLQVTWQRPGDQLPPAPSHQCNTHLIVLCTASNQTSNQTSSTSDYVQGAADDPESWSLGLDAATFWSHRGILLRTPEDELPGLISSLVEEASSIVDGRGLTLIKPTTNIYVAANDLPHDIRNTFDVTVSCISKEEFKTPDQAVGNLPQRLELVCGAGKVGSRQLRHELPKLEQLIATVKPTSRILVTCQTGKDLAVGIVLALLCRVFDDDGNVLAQSDRPQSVNKTHIKQRLSWIMVCMPDAAPSRATLQSVNHFLG